jgi:hypothetical protein
MIFYFFLVELGDLGFLFLNRAMGIDLSGKYLGMKNTSRQTHFSSVASLPVAMLYIL